MYFVPLTAARHHLGTLLVILNKCFIKIIFSVPFSAEDLQNTDGTSDEEAFTLVLIGFEQTARFVENFFRAVEFFFRSRK